MDSWNRMIGQRILNYMKVKGITQTELAEKSGLAQSTISRVINNATDASIGNVVKIAKAMNAPLEAITHPNELVACIIKEISKMTDEDLKECIKHLEKEKLYKSSKSIRRFLYNLPSPTLKNKQ